MKRVAILLVLITVLTSCSINQRFQPLSVGVVNINLEKKDYEFVDEIEGEAKVTRVLIFPFGIKGNAGFLSAGFGFIPWSAVKNEAVYNALEHREDIDYIIAPKYEVKIREYILFGTIFVKVTGKGVRIVD